MKHIFLTLVSVVLFHLTGLSQFTKGEKVLYGNVGASIISGNYASSSPVLIGGMDVRFSEYISVGPSYSFQQMTTTMEDSIVVENLNTYRHNVAPRILFHLSRNASVDYYLGIRLGVTIWKGYNLHSWILEQNHTGARIYPSLQVLNGVRFFADQPFSLNIELGIGSPYFASMGISYKIP